MGVDRATTVLIASPDKAIHIESNSSDNDDYEARTKRRNDICAIKDIVTDIILVPAEPENVVSIPSKLGRNKKQKVSYDTLSARTSPNALTTVIPSLNLEQREAVSSMGLRSMLHLKLHQIPTKLAYWAVDNFDADTCSLRCVHGKIKISEIDVHNILGLELGGRIINLKHKRKKKTPLYNEWINCYENVDKNYPLPSRINKLLSEMNEADDMFRINFLILFFSVMICTPQNSYASTEIFDHITSVDDVKTINWCDCILQSLVYSKKAWMNRNKRGFFSGPLTFLVLLYVDRFEDRGYQIERNWPALKGISDEDLKKRENSEIKYGGFGRGRKLERNPKSPILPKPGDDNNPESERARARSTDMLKQLKRTAIKLQVLKKMYDEALEDLIKDEDFAEEAISNHKQLAEKMVFSIDSFNRPNKKHCI